MNSISRFFKEGFIRGFKTEPCLDFKPADYHVSLLRGFSEGDCGALFIESATDRCFSLAQLIRRHCHVTTRHARILIILPNSKCCEIVRALLTNHLNVTFAELSTGADEVANHKVAKCPVVVPTTSEDFFRWRVDEILGGAGNTNAFSLIVVDQISGVLTDHCLEESLRMLRETFVECRIIGFGSLSHLFLSSRDNPLYASRVENYLYSLEEKINANCMTANRLTMLSCYGPKPKEKLIRFTLFTALNDPDCVDAFQLLNDTLLFVRSLRRRAQEENDLRTSALVGETQRYIMEVTRCLTILGPWCTALVCAEFLKEVGHLVDALKISEDVDSIQLNVLLVAHTCLQQLGQICEQVGDSPGFNPRSPLEEIQPQALRKLIDVLRGFSPPTKAPPPTPQQIAAAKKRAQKYQCKSSDKVRPLYVPWQDDPTALCGLVIVEQRVMALVLTQWLRACAQAHQCLAHILPNYVLGDATSEEESERDDGVVENFRYRRHNLLFVTSSAEKLIDLPHCNICIRLDPPSCLTSYVVSRCRSRTRNGQFVTLVPKHTSVRYLKTLKENRTSEQVLISRSRFEKIVKSEKSMGRESKDVMVKYVPKSATEGATLNNAIAFVNKYCSKLPTDIFTEVYPVTELEASADAKPLYRCTLRLPINSPLKERISGEWMSTVLRAKQSVALHTIKRLHQIGEVNDELCAWDKATLLNRWESLIPGLSPEEVAEREGTGPVLPIFAKRRGFHTKAIAAVFQRDDVDQNSNMYYFYPIVFHLKGLISSDDRNSNHRRMPFDPESSPHGFGILTPKPLPVVCDFPMFAHSGKYIVEVGKPTEVCLSGGNVSNCYPGGSLQQRMDVENFHRFIFRNVLRLESDYVVFDPDASDFNVFVVPTYRIDSENIDVNWALIAKISQQREWKPKVLSTQERQNRPFDASVFSDAVVTPWYGSLSAPQYAFVKNIIYGMSPSSTFSDPEFETFADYFLDKHNIEIVDMNQSLLNVEYYSGASSYNYLIPPYRSKQGVDPMSLSVSSEKTIMLVPELCSIHPLPASLWKQAGFLPSVLYRLNGLLLADELRCRVATEAGLGKPEVTDAEFRWPPLELDINPSANPNGHCDNVLNKKLEEEETASLELSDDGDDFLDDCQLPVGDNADLHFDNFSGCVENSTDLNDKGSNNDELAMKETNITLTTTSYPSWLSEASREWIRSDAVTSGSAPAKEDDVPDDVASRVARFAQDAMDNIDLDEIDDNEDDGLNCLGYEYPFLSATIRQVSDYEAEYSSQLPFISALSADADIWYGAAEDTNDTANIINSSVIDNNAIIADEMKHQQPFGRTLSAVGSDDDNSTDMLSFSFGAPDNITDNKPLGPSPGVLLKALTFIDALAGMNFETLEMVGDAFLKFALAHRLCITYTDKSVAELTFLRNKLASNFNLYCCAKERGIASMMVVAQFDPKNNWLPPCYRMADVEKDRVTDGNHLVMLSNQMLKQNISDKCVADCAEALLGAYLITRGPQSCLSFMNWLGIQASVDPVNETSWFQSDFSGEISNQSELAAMLDELTAFELSIGYTFKNKMYLLEAFTHSSYFYNTFTGCFQKLAFLGNSLLEYAIARYAFELKERESKGVEAKENGEGEREKQLEEGCYYTAGFLTDIVAALVNNQLLAALAVKFNFHRYLLTLSPQLFDLVRRFVQRQKTTDYIQMYREDCEEAEEIEVPKALGDIFESVAGAIFLDAGCSLDAVWRVYFPMMKPEIEYFSRHPPKSPVRELLELEPVTTVFEPAEVTMEGKIRIRVEVFGRGTFVGVGRCKRTAKNIAAKRALKFIKTSILESQLAAARRTSSLN